MVQRFVAKAENDLCAATMLATDRGLADPSFPALA
jgi:hypothetical protein